MKTTHSSKSTNYSGIIKLNVSLLVLLLSFYYVSAQVVVSDPSNLAQSVVNTAKTIGQSEATRVAVLENVLNTQKIFEQTRKYYEYLKTINTVVKDAYELKHTIELASEITSLYKNNFQKISSDPIYTAEEISAISFGYARILDKCANALFDVKSIASSSSVSMTDKERLDILERSHEKMVHYKKLLEYYTRKVQAVSYVRNQTGEDIDGIVRLYGSLTDHIK